MDDSRVDVRTPSPAPRRVCARRGCNVAVKKPTAKYCSVQCCSIDPERLEKLRTQARRASRRTVLPMARQLQISFSSSGNPEEMLNALCEGREDVPAGMRRLIV
jgi:endonuclease YncB( thermonuclease family)